MILDINRFESIALAIKARTHNMPEESIHEAVMGGIGAEFERVTEKCADYTVGNNILRDCGYFNVLGLGNWLMIANNIGMDYIPAQPLACGASLDLFASCMGSDIGERLVEFDKALTKIKDGDMLRFDSCAFSGLKEAISEGNPEINDTNKGWIRDENGSVDYSICNRLVDSFLWNPESHMTAWARPIMHPATRDGWSVTTGQAGKWPVEWRVFVENGKIAGVSNYYPQSSATLSAISGANHVVVLTENLINALLDAKAFPHHPRYEKVRNTEELNFTADYMELDSGDIVLVECGPAHLRNPNWGAHPCCFDPNIGISGGIALGIGNIVNIGIDESA